MARLVIFDGSSTRNVELSDAVTVAGRSSENKIHIDDKQASRKHFQVEKTEFGYKVVDLESRNGTRVNDRVVNQALLRPGDRIQVGKHTLTFEDAGFKEPPSDVAARFAPPAAGAAPPPPPPSDPLLPAGSGGGPETRIRRRTGATTSVMQRVARVEAAKEKKLVTVVGVGAVVFILILLVLVLLPSGGESPASQAARETFTKAQTFFRQGKLDDAEILLGRIGADQKQWHPQAQGMIREIQAARARRAAEVSDAEKKAFDDIYTFGEKRRGDPTAAGTLASKCEAFKAAYPKSANLAKVDEYLAEANKIRKATRGADIAEGEQRSKEALKRGDYATGLKLILNIRDKYKDDLELSDRLLKTHDEIIEQARVHTQKRVAEANDLVARGRNADAAKILEEIVIQMGDGNVEALADYALRARTTLQGLK